MNFLLEFALDSNAVPISCSRTLNFYLYDALITRDFDKIILAKLSDKKQNPKLFEIISKHIINGSCVKINSLSLYIVKEEYSKHYPKDFTITTTTNKNSFPIYKRRDNKKFIKKRGISINIDNRWVVLYNLYLSQKYNYHINLEICSSIKSVKYFTNMFIKDIIEF